MNSVIVKYWARTIETAEPVMVPFSVATERAIDDATDRICDDIDAHISLRCGAWPAPYTSTRVFKRRMDRARSDLERSKLATLKMLLETFQQ